MEFKAFITNSGKYNDGDLVGKWVEFPIDEDDFEKELKEIGIGTVDEFGQPYEEWFVSDYDCEVDCDLGEYPSLEDLNEFAIAIEDANPDFLEDAAYAGYAPKEAIEKLDNGDIYWHEGITNEEALGRYVIEMLNDIGSMDKSTIETYFDYEALGRDVSSDLYESDDVDENSDVIYVTAGEYWCNDENASDEKIGEAIIAVFGIDDISNPEDYFDCEAFGRDLTLGSDLTFGEFTICTHGTIEEIG